MAIRVAHGGGYGKSGEIIANALLAENQRLHQREMQSIDIDARKKMQMLELQNRGAIASAQAQMQYESSREANKTALDKAAIGAGLQEEMQLQAYLNGVAEAKQKARDDAAKFDQKFTTEQRVKDAKLNKAKKAIKDSDQFTEAQKETALMRLDTKIATNADPTQVLGDPNKKPHPSGHEVGVPFSSEGGGTFAITSDGEAKLLVRPDQTIGYLQKQAAIKQEADLQSREVEREESARNEKRETEMELDRRVYAFESKPIQVGSGNNSEKRLPNSAEVENFRSSNANRLGVGDTKAPDTYVSPIYQEVTDLLVPYREKYGSLNNIPADIKERAMQAVRDRHGFSGKSQGDTEESRRWLEQAKSQYGSYADMPDDMKALAVRHKQIAGAGY